MAAGTVSLSGNVFEMLIGHNYERWSVLMKNYLIGEGLWDVISCDDVGDDPDLWRKRNAKALFALQLSCGPDIFKTISDVDSARDAWSRLISLGSDAKGIPLDLVLNVGAGGRDQELYSHVLNVGAGGRDQELYSHGRWWLSRVGIFIRDSILRPLWRSRVGIFFHNSILLKVSPIKELCDRKLVHIQVRVISKLMGRMLRGLDEPQLHEASAYEAMLQAAKYGIVEFIELICEANRVLLWTVDRNKRGIFSHAILNRQGKLFKYLLDETEEQMRMITPRQDVFGNNMLHQAAGLGPSSDLDCRFGAALQLQSEIRWFKEVEKISHPTCKEATNARGKKPREVFSESYKELMEAGEKWAKETATSFTIVCTLIITITFAAAFTVPGGTNQDTGFPIFLKNTLFEVLIMADVASLVTSSSLVLISIVILTSRYTQRDFVTRLPIMLMANLLSLFMSVAAMMVAFCAGIAMML